MVRPVMQWIAVVVTIVMVIVIMVLSVHAPAMRAQNPVVVTLASTTSPNAGEPGVTNVDVVGSNFPSGTIPPANVSVTLKPAVAGPPGATTTATAVGAVIGSVRRVFFVVPSSITVSAPTAYKVSLSGTTSTGAAFSSGNTSSLTINPPAQLLLVSPSSGQAGSSVPVTLTGSFTTFVRGATQASFGLGISVGGSGEGGFGPVTVTSLTTATAQLVIDPAASLGPRAVTVMTGAEQAMLVGGFVVAAPVLPPTVELSVVANDSGGNTLSYQWKATDGTIVDVNAPSTTWTLPDGPGLHFAYVLVSNGVGGYTERRIAVNTDTIGTPPRVPPPLELAAPAAPAQQGDYYRSFATWGGTGIDDPPPPGAVMHEVNAPDVAVHLESSTARYPASGDVLTDLQGQFIIPGVVPGNYTVVCSVDDTFPCGTADTATMVTDSSSGGPLATTDYITGGEFTAGDPISGTFILGDGSPCGTINEFFGVKVTATATLLDASSPPKVLAGPVAVNEFGDYSLPSRDHSGVQLPAAHVLLKCENATPVLVPQPPSTIVLTTGGTDLSKTVLTGVTAPTVSDMTATLNGLPLTSPVALFLPPHTEFPIDHKPFPSNILSRANGYLAEKGLDTRLGACQYYKAVGAVQGCDATGNLIGAISFDDWKRTVKIGPFATGGVPTFGASYINKVDLNLARVHQSISYGPNQTAAVVCNHLGPATTTSSDFLSPAQSDVDTVVDNEVQGKNLVACVAMDYTISPGVNNNLPFIRFLIFGPSGQLLPSVNLDERREKFVPGTCVVCHGGDHYAGKFPEDGTGFANVGGHFLPYDVGNFDFSSKPGLTKCDQQEAIYSLNQNVLNAGPTTAEKELIAGWYANNNGSQCSNVVHVLEEFFVPKSWQDAQSQNPQVDVVGFYQKVNARSCRTCHVAMIEGYNFDHYANLTSANTNRFADVGFDNGINICGGSLHFQRDHMMPNSLVTFNRFWLSADPTANITPLPNQLALTSNFFLATNGDFGSSVHGCPTPAGTTP